MAGPRLHRAGRDVELAAVAVAVDGAVARPAPPGSPWCVQIELKALNSPAVGWVTTVLVAAKILPPPTGMSALAMPAGSRRSHRPASTWPRCWSRRWSCRRRSSPPRVAAAARRAPWRRGRRAPRLPPRGSRYGGRGVLRCASWSASGHGGPPVPGGVGSPLLKGGTYFAPLWFTWSGRASGACGRRDRSRPVLCEGGACRVGRARGARSRGMDRAGVRRVHGGTAGVAGPPAGRPGAGRAGVHGRPGLPAGRVLRPRLLRRGRARLRRADAAGPVLAAPGRRRAAVLPRDGARPEGASTTTATCWSWPSSPRTSSPWRGSTATASCWTGLM